MWSWTLIASADSTASVEHVWDYWSDVRNWPMWDDDLAESRLESNFAAGVEGRMRSKGGTRLQFVLADVEPRRGFACRSKLFCTTVQFGHYLEMLSNGGVRIHHAISARGLLAPILRFTLYPAMRRGLPRAVEALAGLAEERTYEERSSLPSIG